MTIVRGLWQCSGSKHYASAIFYTENQISLQTTPESNPDFGRETSWTNTNHKDRGSNEFDVHESVHYYTIMKVTNKMQIYRLLYYSLSALHVSGDIFAHHQEHLTVFTVSGSVHPKLLQAQPAATWGEHCPIL
jgi:hypothetical protein